MPTHTTWREDFWHNGLLLLSWQRRTASSFCVIDPKWLVVIFHRQLFFILFCFILRERRTEEEENGKRKSNKRIAAATEEEETAGAISLGLGVNDSTCTVCINDPTLVNFVLRMMPNFLSYDQTVVLMKQQKGRQRKQS